MKIFSWMQSKLQVMKKGNKVAAANNHVRPATSYEEFSDWPQSVLSIGTFGFTTLGSDPEENHPQTQTSQQLQEELIAYMDTQELEEEEEDDDDDDEPQSDQVFEDKQLSMFSRGKELLVDNKNTTVIRKKSLTFLLKKFFTSRNRLHPVSLVRDSLPDPTFDNSRMEKILRTILNKKIHPQNSTLKRMANKHLVTNVKSRNDDQSNDEIEGSTWVKTDSEYIVLEI
ncbi:hypothetical protein R6Q59_020861 [Mikania micrantha]|uniref:Uncharacterized protein n=1 Tax=Mikania micrantha TaxID=192012 RepID=A0A5N6PPZ8_9ASTR|nr:hypothetical protein E3N88_06133 [Mikania micrantha]